jgi:hypothetical protein
MILSTIELEDIAKVLRESLPDDSCRAQLGLILYREMKERNAQLALAIHALADGVDLSKLDDETRAVVENLRT